MVTISQAQEALQRLSGFCERSWELIEIKLEEASRWQQTWARQALHAAFPELLRLERLERAHDRLKARIEQTRLGGK